jgi:iron complex outermembrane receptor protein
LAELSSWDDNILAIELADIFYNNRHVKHPIFQWLDFTVDDYGGFVRAVDDRTFGSVRNRLIVGANIQAGTIDTEQFVNLPGAVKGALVASMADKSKNISFYAEDSLFVRPDLALIAGVQYLHATRDRRDRFLSNGDQSGKASYDLWSPRFGILWDATPDVQLFGNVSRSVEIPSYDANIFATPTSGLKAQHATTFEIGTRGRSGAIGWDLSLYRSEIENELQCLTTGPFSACSIVNAGKTVHQGFEAGIDAAVPLSDAGDTLAINAAYTYSDFFFDNDPRYGDNELPGVPRHYLRAEALYKHRSGFYAGPNIEWAPGHYFADNANSLTVDPYALLNLKAGYDPGKRWSIYVEGRNLTGKNYISTVAVAGTASPTAELFNPGIGRAVYVGVRVRW